MEGLIMNNLKPNAPIGYDPKDPHWMLQKLIMDAIRTPDRYTPWDRVEALAYHQARAVIIALNLSREERKTEQG